ncbi:MAG: hypothetical protein RL625_104 [Gemmatimonadota bacterium]
MKVCVLQPDYSTSGVDYRHYDPARDLSPLLPGHEVHHVAIHKLSTYRQLQGLAGQGFDIFVNLCEGYHEWDTPGVDVCHALAALNLPHTGPTATFFHIPKPTMKYLATSVGVATPMHVLVDAPAVALAHRAGDAPTVDRLLAPVAALRMPCFVKPAHAGDSLGVDEHAVVRDRAALLAQVLHLADEFPELLVEEYVDGREFTVLIVGDPEKRGRGMALTPVEYRFPEGFRYKSYVLKTSELHPHANVAVDDPTIDARLREAAERIFTGFGAMGYARMDFRMDAHGTLWFLEVNFTCSVFYEGDSGGSADHILRLDPMGPQGFLERIMAEGIARHRERQPLHEIRGNAIAGYGVVARRAIAPGEAVFRGEGRAHRLVTRSHVLARWEAGEQELFRHYAVPISDEVYAIWDEDPMAWAPMNHSCAPNSGYRGLDVVALHAIAAGEELTLDYATMLNEQSASFACQCGAANCRGTVQGRPGTTIGR